MQPARLSQCHFKKQRTDRTHVSLSTLITAPLHTHTLMPTALWVLLNSHCPACCLSLSLSLAFCLHLLLPLSLPPSVFLCLFTPPTPPPLPAVFAVSFSARHPEAAVAPASLPTSVFVVGDDMSKLWRAEEGRERGREREGKEHITRRGGKARDPERMSCGLQSAQIFSFSPSLSPSRAVYVGRQEWRQEATPPPSSLHPLLPSFSSLLTPHVFPASPPPFPLSYSTSLSAPLLSLLRAKFLFINCLFSPFSSPSFALSVFLTHRRACAS